MISKQTAIVCRQREWEYAALGGKKSKGYLYSGSDNIDEVAWYRDNSDEETHPVKQKKANELGLYDMSGNLYDWCWDWYDENDDIFYSAEKDYAGPLSGDARVYRGGSWYHTAFASEVIDHRNGFGPQSPDDVTGFRVVRSVKDE